MKPGEVANGKKFDKALTEIQKAYGKHGHIQAHMKPEPQFDDATSRVTFKIAVNEGPQFRMGTVEFKGFSSGDAAVLSKMWGLKSGEIYDQSYASQFFRKDAGETMTRIAKERQFLGKPLLNLNTVETPDRQTLIVNLMIELKN
jgi:outer membrane protein assembly factor BamA